MKEFENQVAVITGAASGLGYAIAEECIRRKMKTVLTDFDSNSLQIAYTSFQKKYPGSNLLQLVIDVTKTEDMQRMHDETIKAFGKVHLLFSNAGAGGPPSMFAPKNSWDWILKLNLISVIDGMRIFVPTMIKQQEPAYVVATASIYGLHTGHRPYGVTKQAVVATCEAMQLELKEMGIRHVNIASLCPSWIQTNIAANGIKYEESGRQNGDAKMELERQVGIEWFKRHAAPVQTVVDAFFEGVENERNYFHTHLDHSRLFFESRVDNILEHQKIDDNEGFKEYFRNQMKQREVIAKELMAKRSQKGKVAVKSKM